MNSRSGYAYSTNGGANFTDGGFVPADGNKLGGDPSLAFGPDGTTLYYASIGTDAGEMSRASSSPLRRPSVHVTFGTSVAISGVTSGAKQDKELIAVDTTQGPYRGRVYVAWSEFPNPNSLPDGKSSILFAASSSTIPLQFSTHILSPLSPPATVNNHGAMPAVAPNSDVYVVWSVFTPGTAPAPQTI